MRIVSGLLLIVAAGCGGAAATTRAPAPEPQPPSDVTEDLVGEVEDYSDPDRVLKETPPDPTREPHPFAETSDEALEAMLLETPDELGPVSIGRPASGSLFGAVPMPEGDEWHIVNPRETWGTVETTEFIAHTVRRVNELFPGTPVLPIGDISDQDGGHLVPHVSHQSGRDVDIGYYYTTDAKWYTRATESNLDLPRTWAFVKVTIEETDVQAMFIDRKIQRWLHDYALSIGENPLWLEQIFGGPNSDLRPLIMHEDGHDTHIHVRYYNPIAQETGRRIYLALLEHKMIKPPTYYVTYKVKRGDNLGKMARKFKTTIKDLQRANRLKNTRIIAGRTYKIPRRGGVSQPKGPIVIPQRRTAPPLGVPPVDSEVTATADSSTVPAESTPTSSPTAGPNEHVAPVPAAN